MLTMTGLTKTYRTDTVETTALDNVDLDIADGEFVAIMGPSGCGKSTLLNVMGMLDSPTGGSYVFNGHEVAGLSESQLADTRKSNIGFIFQSFNLVDELTVRENVELALLYHDHSGRASARRGSTGCSTRSASPTAPSIARPSFRAASSSASPSPARWSASPS